MPIIRQFGLQIMQFEILLNFMFCLNFFGSSAGIVVCATGGENFPFFYAE